jgi:serine-type D-Ala-D-Ala carboxypeptidase/endopeptidase
MGLLGQALANRAGVTYAELAKQKITGPLGLKDTVIGLSPYQYSRFLQGHDAEHREVHAWDLDAFGGAGGIRSTAGDMLTYLEVGWQNRRSGRSREPSKIISKFTPHLAWPKDCPT